MVDQRTEKRRGCGVNGTAERELVKGIMAGEREPVNRAERRAWDRHKAADARRGRRAHARIERGIARYKGDPVRIRAAAERFYEERGIAA